MSDENIIKLTPFRADLTRALARKGERLLAAADRADEVATLEPLEAYYVVKEIGLDQALPILQELNHDQLQAGIDLDCWSHYDFRADSFDKWLAAFALAGPEALANAFLSLDYVVQLLFLAQTVTVYDPDTDQIPQEDKTAGKSRAMTPDGIYLLELKAVIPLKIHPFTLLDALYQYDPTVTHQILSDIRVDLPTQIEEEALRFRSSRMQDLGFVTPDEASILFSRPKIHQPMARPRKPMDSASTLVPSVYAAPLSKNSLLQQALSLITDQERLSMFEQEIVWAINSAIIAYGEKKQDIDQITNIAERVRDTISLGLESLLTQQDPDCLLDDNTAAVKASELLDIWCITDLFRHGFSATMSLQREVHQALGDPRFQTWYNLPETEQSDEPEDRLERAFVAALLGRHPLRSGFDLEKAEQTGAFANLADINVAHFRLKRLIARICH
jgi:hypothetical protein